MSVPLTVVTVELPHPIRGSKLIEAIEAITGEGDDFDFKPAFHKQSAPNSTNSFIVGQRSRHSYLNVLVAPTESDHTIRPKTLYTQVRVMHIKWPNATVLKMKTEASQVEEAVQVFSENLKNFLDSQQRAKPSAWPQAVEVCTVCENILQMRLNSTGNGLLKYCPTHGSGVTAKVVGVTIVPVKPS